MTWEDQGLWFTLILNGIALAILIPLAYYLHTSKVLSISRIYRPNHTIEPTKPPHAGSPEDRLPSAFESEFEDKDQKKKAHEATQPPPHQEQDQPEPIGAPQDRIPEERVFGGAEDEDRPPVVNQFPQDDPTERQVDQAIDDAGKDRGDQMGRLDTRKKSSLFSLPPLRRLLSVGEEPWEADGDDEPLRSDPQADLFLMYVKVCFVIFFIGTALSTAWLALAYGLDNYIYRLTLEKDPAECRGSSNGDCLDNPLCAWDGISCQPTGRNGLYDLSLQNATPRAARLWATGVLALLFALMCTAAMYRALKSITGYHRRVLKRQLKHAIGYRTVVVKGLAVPPKEVMAQHTTKKDVTVYKAHPEGLAIPVEDKITVDVTDSMIPGYPGSDIEHFKNEYLTSHNYFGEDAKIYKGYKIDDLSLFGGSTGVSAKVEDVVMERDAHKKFYDAYNDYEEAKTAHQDAIAAERQYHKDLIAQRKVAYALLDDGTVKDKSGGNVTYEKETALPPLMGRVVPKCCSSVPIVEHRKKDLIEKGEKLNKSILKGQCMPFSGSVFIIFKDALSAFEFAELFHHRFGGPCSALSAHIAGPYEKIEVLNLSKGKHLGAVIMLIMAILFAILVFFWAVPVGFLGSLDSLASIPGIGPAFQTFIDVVPTTIVGILTAYLPVIVLAVFNIVLPMLIRFFVVSSGSLTQLETDHGVMLEMYLFLVLTGVVFQAALQGGLAQLGTIIADPSQDVIFAFIAAVISPKGGYWYASVIGAGCLSMWINAILIAPIAKMLILSKRASTQHGYNALFARQDQTWPLKYAATLVITTIGFFFHVTVPLLGIFTGIFFLNQYFVYRGLLLDGWAPALVPDELVSNFKFPACNFRIMSVCFLIATIGAAIVVGLKEHIGGLVFCCIAVAVSIFLLVITFYMSSKWALNYKNVRDALAAKGSEIEQQRRANGNESEPSSHDAAVAIPKEASSPVAKRSSPVEEEDGSPLAVALKNRKPYRSIHTAASDVVNVEDAVKVAKDKKYGVVMVWHSEKQRAELAADHDKDNEKEGKKLAKEIAAGKHKPVQVADE